MALHAHHAGIADNRLRIAHEFQNRQSAWTEDPEPVFRQATDNRKDELGPGSLLGRITTVMPRVDQRFEQSLGLFAHRASEVTGWKHRSRSQPRRCCSASGPVPASQSGGHGCRVPVTRSHRWSLAVLPDSTRAFASSELTRCTEDSLVLQCRNCSSIVPETSPPSTWAQRCN